MEQFPIKAVMRMVVTASALSCRTYYNDNKYPYNCPLLLRCIWTGQKYIVRVSYVETFKWLWVLPLQVTWQGSVMFLDKQATKCTSRYTTYYTYSARPYRSTTYLQGHQRLSLTGLNQANEYALSS